MFKFQDVYDSVIFSSDWFSDCIQ